MKRRRKTERPILPGPLASLWEPASYEIATFFGIETVDGYTLGGLGLALVSAFRSKHRRKDGTRRVEENWNLTHLNTGHAVRYFRTTDREQMLAAATDFAQMGDWTFDGLQGWKNTMPDMGDRIAAWAGKHGKIARPAGSHGNYEDQARAIGAKRW